MKTALITGISGQDGQYCAELLLEKGYRVIGTSRTPSETRIRLPINITQSIELIEWGLQSEAQLREMIETFKPSEIYNFAALSSGEKMFEDPVGIGFINGLAVTKILQAIKELDPQIRFAQASSAEMFGKVTSAPQSENTPFHPISPYGVSKLYGHQMVGVYRERHAMFACSAILFNHESPRRGKNFVTRKITHTAAQIKLGLADRLVLGNLDMSRDWIHAKDAVRAMWMMLQASKANDYVVAGGVSRSVRSFCELTFDYLGLNYEDYVISSPEFFRPVDSVNLVGNSEKLRSLGWAPQSTFEDLVHSMVDHDLALLGS
jgi:GDPmannose 4,6-dehydratase